MRTSWKLHLSLAASNFDDVGDLQKSGCSLSQSCTCFHPGTRDAGGGDPVGPGGAATPAHSKSQQICDNMHEMHRPMVLVHQDLQIIMAASKYCRFHL